MPQLEPNPTPEQDDYARTGQGGSSRPPSGGGAPADPSGGFAAPQPQGPTIEDELDSYAMHQVQSRVANFPIAMIEGAPWTTTALAFSNLDGRSVGTLANSMGSVWEWLNASNSFAGVQGRLLVARAQALSLGDTGALQALDELQALPPNMQEVLETQGISGLLTALQEQGDKGLIEGIGSALGVGVREGVEGAVEAVGSMLSGKNLGRYGGGTEEGRKALDEAKGLLTTLPDEFRPLGERLLAHLEEGGTTGTKAALLPNEQLRSSALAGSPDFDGVRVAFLAVNHVVLQAEDVKGKSVQELEAVLRTLIPDVTIEYQGTGASGALARATAYLGESFKQSWDMSAGLALKAGGGALDATGLHPLRGGAEQALSAAGSVFGRGTDILSAPITALAPGGEGSYFEQVGRYAWPDSPGTGVGEAYADALGIKEDDPRRESVVAGASIIGGWIFGRWTAKGFRAAKAGRYELKTVEGVGPSRESFGPAFRKSLPSLSKVIYDFFQKTPEERAATGWGKRFANDVLETNRRFTDAERVGGLTDSIPDLRRHPDIARRLANATNPEEVFQALDDSAYFGATRERYSLLRRRRRTVQRTLERGVDDADTLAALEGELLDIDHKLSIPEPLEPLLTFPRSRGMRAAGARAARGVPKTGVGALVHALYARRFGALAPPISRLFDEVLSQDLIYPKSHAARVDQMAKNVEIVSSQMRRFGVPNYRVREVVGRFTDAATPTEFFEANKMYREALYDSLGSKHVGPAMRENIRLWADTSAEARHKGLISSKEKYGNFEDVLQDEYGNPLPGMEAELVHRIPGIPVDTATQVTSYTRRALQRVRSKGSVLKTTKSGREITAGDIAALPVTATKAISNTLTQFLKGLVLTGGPIPIRALTWFQRIGTETSVRVLVEGHRPFARKILRVPGGDTLRGLPATLGENYRSEYGLFDEAIRRSGAGKTTYQEVNLKVPKSQGATIPYEVYQDGIARRLRLFAESPAMRELARRGPEGFVRWVDNAEYGQFWRDTLFGDILDRAGKGSRSAGLKDLAQRKWQELQELTGGNEDLIDSVATGAWRQRGGRHAEVVQNGLPVDGAELYGSLMEQRSLMRKERMAAAAEGNDALVYALDKERRRINRQLGRLEVQGLGKADAKFFNVPLSSKKFASALRNAKQRGDYEPPDYVMVEKRPVLSEGGDFFDHTREIRDMAARGFYWGGRIVSYLDMRGPRGSYAVQILREHYDIFRKMGMKHEDALAHARVRAARATIDLHYDIATKTSAHRAMKNVFWFAPALQEIATTWLYKIPSRYYWPVGAAYLANRLELTKDLFEQLDLLKEDPSTGKKYIVIPGLLDLIAGVTPDVGPFKGIQRASETPGAEISTSLTSVNLIFSGPSPSTQYLYLLDKGLKKYGEPFKAIANIVAPYSTEVRWMPQAWSHLFTAVTGEKPPWDAASPALQGQLYDLGFDHALQAAYRIVGPAPDAMDPKWDTKTIELEGAKLEVLTAKGERQYKKARDAWRNDLESEARQMQEGWSAVRLIGATLSPFSLVVDDPYAKEMSNLLNDLFFEDERSKVRGDSLTEAESQRIEDWVLDHPNSLAYTVYRSMRTGEKTRDLPYNPDPQDAFYADLLTGERKVLKPEEFTDYLMAIESYRLYGGQLDRELREIAPSGKASELLLNMWDRKEALLEYHEGMDRFFGLNPESKEIVEAKRAAWAKMEDVPVNTLAAERLTDLIRGIENLDEFFIRGGRRDRDWRNTIRQMRELFDETGLYGEPRTEMEKDINWYFESVFNPYMEAVQPLYDEARALGETGSDAGEVYDKIRNITNQWAKKTYRHNGQVFPSPEEMMWGNQTVVEREDKRLKWASEPVGWLSNFQREQVGIESGPKVNRFFNYADTVNDQFYRFVDKNDISSSSKDYERLVAYRDRLLSTKAKELGVEDLYALDQSPPITRITTLLNYGANSQMWKDAHSAVQYVVGELEKHTADNPLGLSIRSYSQRSVELRVWFFNIVRRTRDPSDSFYDEQFDDLMERISFAFPYKEGYMEGFRLYEALYFGNFDPDHPPDEVINAANGKQYQEAA